MGLAYGRGVHTIGYKVLIGVEDVAGCEKGDLSGLLPDGRIVLDSKDRLPLLQHTRSTTLASRLQTSKTVALAKRHQADVPCS